MRTDTKQMNIADLIADRLAAIDKTQRQVADECGFEAPNIITMFKQGRTKVPLDRIGALAKSLDLDPAYLLRVAMQEYMPETWIHIEHVMQSTLLTANELALIAAYRRIAGGRDVPVSVIESGLTLAAIGSN